MKAVQVSKAGGDFEVVERQWQLLPATRKKLLFVGSSSQLRMLTRSLWLSVMIQAALVAVAHGGNQSVTQFLKHGLSGCIFTFIRVRKSL